ncbi:hypothetical protein P8625_09910 [Tenacibaculum tangerinum]|uniref:DUF6794 domain-containing protein n=1 Tax=Tenacibaculum tangerinum TaxID=3038772 RepID=A0ABY8L3F3_9FLAO|nr:DUF6794 domain-containing protein [Tenacibaculum tangerinum]WGH74420.1 hypothetical protein P8625_09910 [Tenacibaculum tangerinum]
MRKYVYVCTVFIFINCQSEKVLDNSFEKIKYDLGKEKLNDFANKKEKKAVSNLYMTYGIHFRNEYLINNTDSQLIEYFKGKGINSYDVISYIVFTSLHRKLNNKPLNINNQIEIFENYKKDNLDCDKKNKERAKKYYNLYEVSDTLTVRMKIRKDNAIEILCLERNEHNWEFDDSKDLIIKGILKSKSDLLPSFQIEVLELNKDGVMILMEKVTKGDSLDVDLRYNIIEDRLVN